MNDKIQFPSIYQMVPNEDEQYTGIVQLLLHFRWTWVGIIALDDHKGDWFVQKLMLLFYRYGICFAFIERLPTLTSTEDMVDVFYLSRAREAFFSTKTQVRVFAVTADTHTILVLKYFILLEQTHIADSIMGKVWILTAEWDFSLQTIHRLLDVDVFNGALSFAFNSNEVEGFQNFLHTVSAHWPKGDGFIRLFWEQAFNCLLQDYKVDKEKQGRCTRKENLERLPGTFFEMSMTAQSYSIYNAVYAIAQALNALYSARWNHGTVLRDKNTLECAYLQPYQVK